MAFPMEPLHLLHQDDQIEVKHYFFGHVMPLAQLYKIH